MSMIDPKRTAPDPGESPQDGIRLEDEWLEGAEHDRRKNNPPPDGIDQEHLAI
jgi:hypothetical protein